MKQNASTSYRTLSRRRFLSFFTLLGRVTIGGWRPRSHHLIAAPDALPRPFRQDEPITLPEPVLDGEVALEQVWALRRSVRAYTDETLTMEQIGQLLWAAQGITSEDGKRTAPSAWATYPLDVYVVQTDTCYHYRPEDHALELVTTAEDLQRSLARAAGDQACVATAPVVFVITSETKRVRFREEFGVQEIGHAAQNLLLQAVALGLGAVPAGSMERQQVQEVLQLPAGHVPYTVIPVGYPA
jgi:SagB-type dehydrogenase family enzyme